MTSGDVHKVGNKEGAVQLGIEEGIGEEGFWPPVAKLPLFACVVTRIGNHSHT